MIEGHCEVSYPEAPKGPSGRAIGPWGKALGPRSCEGPLAEGPNQMVSEKAIGRRCHKRSPADSALSGTAAKRAGRAGAQPSWGRTRSCKRGGGDLEPR